MSLARIAMPSSKHLKPAEVKVPSMEIIYNKKTRGEKMWNKQKYVEKACKLKMLGLTLAWSVDSWKIR